MENLAKVVDEAIFHAEQFPGFDLARYLKEVTSRGPCFVGLVAKRGLPFGQKVVREQRSFDQMADRIMRSRKINRALRKVRTVNLPV